MSNFTAALDQEIQHLEKIVEAIPEVVKLRELQRVRALYGPSAGVGQARGFAEVSTTVSGAGRKMAPERQRAIEFVSVHLTGQTNPIKTADLLLALQGNGIDIGGSDPVNSLSALLSTSGRFVAHGRSGWTLKRDADGSVPLTRTEIDDESTVSAQAQAKGGNPGAASSGVFTRRL
jgi:hypothetical protein